MIIRIMISNLTQILVDFPLFFISLGYVISPELTALDDTYRSNLYVITASYIFQIVDVGR